VSELKSSIRDSSLILSQLAAEASRTRTKVKRVATFSASSAVVFVPRPVVCVCQKCQNLLGGLRA
jgi:hypothetical protein